MFVRFLIFVLFYFLAVASVLASSENVANRIASIYLIEREGVGLRALYLEVFAKGVDEELREHSVSV